MQEPNYKSADDANVTDDYCRQEYRAFLASN